jgi:ubiquitin-protein ligase
VTSPSPGAAGTHRRQRLLRDRELLAAHEPQLRFEIDADGETAEAIGSLSIQLPDGSPEAIEVRIEFRSDYPRRPPRAYDTHGRWTPELDRHIEGGGRFCLFLPGANEPDLKPEGALLHYIADLKAFLRQQLILDSQRRHNPNARFPGPEWPHGIRGAYAIFAAESLAKASTAVPEQLWEAAKRADVGRTMLCPCNSGKTIGDCHRPTLKNLRRALWEIPDLARLTYDQLLAYAQTQTP